MRLFTDEKNELTWRETFNDAFWIRRDFGEKNDEDPAQPKQDNEQ